MVVTGGPGKAILIGFDILREVSIRSKCYMLGFLLIWEIPWDEGCMDEYDGRCMVDLVDILGIRV